MRHILLVLFLAMTLGGITLADPPATQPSPSSKPVEKDGLQVTVTLPKATFTADEPLKFSVEFKNVSKAAFMLDDADMFWNWVIRFEDEQWKGPWQLHETFLGKRKPEPTNNALKPSEVFTVPVEIDPAKKLFELVWKGPQLESVGAIRQLKPGKYRLTMEIVLEENPLDLQLKWPCWKGKITPEPVEFEVTNKPATQPARTKTNEKGWELRIWEEKDQTCYALLPGTNRLKADEEITKAAVKDLDALKKQLMELKEGQELFLMGFAMTDQPPAGTADAVIKYCDKIGLKVQGEK